MVRDRAILRYNVLLTLTIEKHETSRGLSATAKLLAPPSLLNCKCVNIVVSSTCADLT